jgi:hypothetical protein
LPRSGSWGIHRQIDGSDLGCQYPGGKNKTKISYKEKQQRPTSKKKKRGKNLILKPEEQEGMPQHQGAKIYIKKSSLIFWLPVPVPPPRARYPDHIWYM